MSMVLTRMAGLVALGACVLGAACASSGAPGGELDGGGDDGGAIVDAGPDVLTFDADTTDAAPLKGFGEICTNKDECQSHICVFSGLTGVCSMICGPPECPEGFGCYSVLGGIDPGQIAEICVPESDQLCSTCADSSECATAAQDLCLTDADGLEWCARDCSAVSCPSGYDCADVDVGGTSYRQCLPSSGACDCDASTSGATKPCVIPTPFGMCLGSKSCLGANGWAMCAPPSATDVPDGNFADENCDGIDGDIDEGIFVATSGADSGTCGLTHQTPCQTVHHGVIRAVTANKGAVYVQAGVYEGVVTMLNGIDIYGGYDTSWQRAGRGVLGHETRLLGALDAPEAQFMTIKAHNLIVPTIVADVVIEGPDATGTVGPNGRSSYAVHVKGTSGLSLERVTIVAGDGAPGAAGGDGQNATNIGATVGMEGEPGDPADEFNTACNSSSHGGGGAGGTNNQCGGGLDTTAGGGGNGGEMDSSCGFPPNLNATGGDNGGNAAQFSSNAFGFRGGGGSGSDGNCLGVGAGGSGNPGRIQNGSAGEAGTGHKLDGVYWMANPGTAGGIGQNGGGGGGGGGAGGCDSGTDSYGAGGGGGGAGGCRAPAAAGGGGGGGGSFGVFAISSSLSVADCAITRGVGGNGGAGGTGGAGQSGGPPGGGGVGEDSAAGGAGGKGGHGGHGGGGGGGAGGASFGIFGSQATITQTCTFSGGLPGNGGPGGQSAPAAPLAERDGAAGPAGAGGASGGVGVCASPGGC